MLEQIKNKLKNMDINKIISNIRHTNPKKVLKSSVLAIVPRKKHLLRTTLISLSGLAIGLVVLFPYEIVVGKIIQSTAAQNNINIHYDELKVSIRKLTMNNVTVGTINAKPYKINSIVTKYSPLSAITKSARVTITHGNTKINAKVSPKSVNAKGLVDLTDVANIMPGSPIGDDATGNMSFALTYSTTSGDGKIRVRSDALAFTANSFPLKLKNVKLDSTITGNNADISLTTQDTFNINMNGNVNLNPQNIGSSMLNLRGSVLFFGQKQTFTLGGTVNNPAPNLGG